MFNFVKLRDDVEILVVVCFVFTYKYDLSHWKFIFRSVRTTVLCQYQQMMGFYVF